ncbi:SCP-like protein [Ancylostoma ceylanicum]|uniref:SCP-like protein n=1 Tax=Ancylostoma ceylanicum TaxID=53326 RepID=A0A0D6M9Z0_9BILA|nr:SCP-like protein [Ancylostoma ceylanicum]
MRLTVTVLAFILALRQNRFSSAEARAATEIWAYPVDPPMCENPKNKDNLRHAFLDFHNNARRRVAQGIERIKQKRLGPAKNMYELAWNCEMELKAQDQIKNCDGSVEGFGSWSANSIRYNIGVADRNRPKPLIEKALRSWWEGGSVLGKDNKYTDESLYYFGNMVHAATTQIGCAYAICGDIMQIFCLYDDIGHIDGMVLYEKGEACKSGEDCITYKDSICYNHLCKKPHDEPDDGNSEICSDSNGMTDKMRNRMLELHNQYRSLVARGEAEDRRAPGRRTPNAAGMRILRYTCNLENTAVTHARKCVSEHSEDEAREGAGENLYSISIANADKLKTGERACRTWFGELHQVGVGQENLFTQKLLNRAERIGEKIGHYTQMVWGTTEEVGCAIHHCPEKTLVVCNYKESGNWERQQIYKTGELCSECPEGYSCTDEKLCAANEK